MSARGVAWTYNELYDVVQEIIADRVTKKDEVIDQLTAQIAGLEAHVHTLDNAVSRISAQLECHEFERANQRLDNEEEWREHVRTLKRIIADAQSK